MIKIEAVLEPDGTLRGCRVSGHAGTGKTGGKVSALVKRLAKALFKRKGAGKGGSKPVKGNVVCAAVSILMRSAFYALSDRKGITVRCGTPEKGQLWLEADYEAEGKDFLNAAGVFLIKGLSSVAQEFPENCKLNISVYH
jgi:hypothetical protein